jgi:hypothetical protein
VNRSETANERALQARFGRDLQICPMMKPIKFLGAAVVAVAAPALFTRPAAADIRSVARVKTLLGSDTKLTFSIGSGYDDCHRGSVISAEGIPCPCKGKGYGRGW